MHAERYPYDVVVHDAAGQVVLVAEVKAPQAADEQVEQMVMRESAGVPYTMLADPELIRIYQQENGRGARIVFRSPASAVLSLYDPEFGRKRIYQDYLVALIEGWLRDIAFHWKSPRPPGSEELESLGLAQRLRGGMTSSSSSTAGVS